MIEIIVFLNGIYDILCALCIMKIINLRYFDKIHLNMFIQYNHNLKRKLSILVLTNGLIRITNNYKLISLSYIVEAIYFLNELLHNNIFIYSGLFVIITCLILHYLSWCLINN